MTIWILVLILCFIISVGSSFIWIVIQLSRDKNSNSSVKTASFGQRAQAEVEHIFNDEFREELRNRGRLHFEKVIGENAMFLQQDLRLTTSQLNEYMKGEITRKLQEEFKKYEQSIMDAKQLAVDSIQKTNTAIDEQRQLMNQKIQEQITIKEQNLIEYFDKNTAKIINHYLLQTIGDKIDLNDQMDLIISTMEANKKDILEDIQNGA